MAYYKPYYGQDGQASQNSQKIWVNANLLGLHRDEGSIPFTRSNLILDQ